MYFAAGKVEKKRTKNSFANEGEMEAYELETGIKRRSRLANVDHYKFVAMPVPSSNLIDRLTTAYKDTMNIKIIDADQLVEEEKSDESKRYSYLLQDLASQGKPLPKGLVTALVKHDIAFYMNTTKGTQDSVIIVTNYPKTVDDASRFENDVAVFDKFIVNHADLHHRDIDNLTSYFETIGKSEVV